MHVAVAPACNIQCNYCNRKYDCANESRPGVVSERLTPEQAALKVEVVAAKMARLSVIGIAGPGDPLANPRLTFETFELISKKNPDLRLCLSTNGLALPDAVDRIRAYNIDHVTITINTVEPEIGERIYPWVFYNHKRWKGRDAAKILLERQMEGLERLTEAGILCKINSVMIPGVNDEDLYNVNREVKSRGAFLHNIMPLISDPAHGTRFGLDGQRGPTDAELKALQDSLEGEMTLMRHCRQCRADAVGLLGEDRNEEFTIEKIEQMKDEIHRVDTREVEEERKRIIQEQRRIRELLHREKDRNSGEKSDLKFLVAVATKGDNRVNLHFGHAEEFQIYEVGSDGVKFVTHRKTENYCKGNYGEEDVLDGIIEMLKDCRTIFVSKIGPCPKRSLADAKIEVSEEFAEEYIAPSIMKYYNQVTGESEPTVLPVCENV